jgi:hypothetical protein
VRLRPKHRVRTPLGGGRLCQHPIQLPLPNALENNVNFYRVVQASWREIKGAATKVTSDTWHSLSVNADGDRFTITFDGKVLFTAADLTFMGAGKIALWTNADSVTHFDQLAIAPRP